VARQLLEQCAMRLPTLAAVLAVIAPAIAAADDQTAPAPSDGPNQPIAAVPAEHPYATEPQPATAPPPAPTNVVDEAHVRRAVPYGQEGVREVGGSAGLTLASNMRDINFSPSIGWFLHDNFEVSGILSVSNLKAGNESSTAWSALVEPSFHFQMNRELYTFVGVGVGAAYIDPLGTALAVAPRVGMNFLVGRSGILTPSLSYEYTMHDQMKGADGTSDVTLLAVSSALRANIGYSVMW
jgi:hypothetical protein